jgi:predicted DsbA family dithiol-disulfide isomerase
MMFAEAGLPHAETLEKVPNSRRSLLLSQLARDRGLLEALHPRLFDAYWARALDIGDQQVLVEEGTAAGLDEGEIIDTLQSEGYLPRIEEETRSAIALGASGVPAWVIDRRVLILGAQPREVFAHVLQRLGHTPLNGTTRQEE